VITGVDAWGDMMLSLTPAHLARLGIKHGMTVKFEFGGKKLLERGREFKVKYGGNSFLSVNQGEWYTYDHAEGARSGS
jgi:hypothetical protein